MRIFSLMNMQFQEWEAKVRDYLSKTFAEYNVKYGSNTIFGQLINVLGSTTQNVMSYIEDALTEQNKYTASRKRSVYSLAALSGYEPSLGTSSTCLVKVDFLPTTSTQNVIIPNKTRLVCSQNGLNYNILMNQESIIMNMNDDNSSRYFTLVEGIFESQKFISQGGSLYAINVKFNGDSDLRYIEVYVNDELWEREESLYDMIADGKQYVVKTAMTKGIDIVFGNNMHGRALDVNDVIKVVYLLHNGEEGNIISSVPVEFQFEDVLVNNIGDSVDGNNTFNITLQNQDYSNSGTYSESTDKVREMIGMNSRSLILSDAKNYKQFFSRYSFVGYNRTWVEPGSMIINSLIMRNFKLLMNSGEDYFNIDEHDFTLNSAQKNSIINSIKNSGQMIAGSIFKILDPEICKYSMMIYIKLKDKTYDKETVTSKIKKYVGDFFADIKSDMFIPKSDIVKLIKDKCEEVDGVNVYFISDRNEQAKKNNYYTNKIYKYNPITGTYDVNTETVYLYRDENPMLGLDNHGNIYLENDFQFPILSSCKYWEDDDQSVNLEPVTIIYE